MELSTFAIIIGILELLIGIPLLVAGGPALKFMTKFIADEFHMRVFGAVVFIISVFVLLEGATIGTDPEGLIRLVAWIVAIKGITVAWKPGVLVGLSGSFLRPNFAPIIGILGTAIGVLLLYGSTLL